MQFIPSTWRKWGTDANGDGKADPGNIVDAATAAGRYLCRAAGDLTLGTEAGVIRAILSYNPNQTYLRVVGARFEALASDLALGWFSAAALPPAPAAGGGRGPERRPGRAGGDRERSHPHRAARHDRHRGPGLRGPGPDDVDHRARDDRARRVRRPDPGPRSPGRVPPVRPDRGRAPRPLRGRARTTPRSSAACRTRPARPSCSAWPARRPRPSSGPRRRTGCWSWTAATAACPSRRRSRPGLRRPQSTTTTTRRRPAGRAPTPPTSGTAPTSTSPTTGTSSSGAASRVEHDHGDDRPPRQPRPRRPRRRATSTATSSGTDAAHDLGRAEGQGAQRRQGLRRPPPRRRPPRRHRPRPSRSPSGRPMPAAAAPPSSGRRTARAPTWVALVRQAGLADRQLVVLQTYA